jgi:small multidrug resistance pump
MVLKRGMPVGVAYGVWSAIGVAATVILGRYLFGDPFTWAMAGGVVLIAAGVCLLETGHMTVRSSTSVIAFPPCVHAHH